MLDALWAFLDAPAAEINLTLAGYFSRVTASLFEKYPSEVIDYLRKRDANAVLESFLERLHSRSLAELLIKLLSAERASLVAFPTENLMGRLLIHLDKIDTQDNVVLIVLELLSQKEVLSFHDDLLRQLVSCGTIAHLVDRMFNGQAATSAAAMILSSAVFHACIVQQTTGASMPTKEGFSHTGNFPPDDVLGGSSDVGHMCMSEHGQALVHELCSHFRRIRSALDAALRRDTTAPMPLGPVNNVEVTTLEVISLLATLVRTGAVEVLESVLQNQLLPRCLEVFFNHPWSSLLHNAVKALFNAVVNPPCQGSEGALNESTETRRKLMQQMLWEGGLVDRIIAEYEEERKYQSQGVGQRRKPPRVGYMGHLHGMCHDIQEFGLRIPECGVNLASAMGWSDIVMPTVDASLRIQNELLGGGVPAGDRGLASASGGQGSAEPEFMDEADLFKMDETEIFKAIKDISEDEARQMLGAAPIAELNTEAPFGSSNDPSFRDEKLFDPGTGLMFGDTLSIPAQHPESPSVLSGGFDDSFEASWVADFDTDSQELATSAPPDRSSAAGNSGAVNMKFMEPNNAGSFWDADFSSLLASSPTTLDPGPPAKDGVSDLSVGFAGSGTLDLMDSAFQAQISGPSLTSPPVETTTSYGDLLSIFGTASNTKAVETKLQPGTDPVPVPWPIDYNLWSHQPWPDNVSKVEPPPADATQAAGSPSSEGHQMPMNAAVGSSRAGMGDWLTVLDGPSHADLAKVAPSQTQSLIGGGEGSSATEVPAFKVSTNSSSPWCTTSKNTYDLFDPLQPLGPQTTPVTPQATSVATTQPSSDLSWFADFDPLLQPNACDAPTTGPGKPEPSDGVNNRLSALAPFWLE